MESFKFTKEELLKFKSLSIGALVLFGSRAQGTYRDTSDYDFGVIVEDKSILFKLEKRKQLYEDLYDILSSHIKKLVNIDIVFLEDAPGELQAHVMRHGKAVYESNPNIFADFNAYAMISYADFAPFREIFQKGVLSNIK